MATASQVVTAAPTALVGIDSDTQYALYNAGSGTLRVSIAAAPPSATTRDRFPIRAGEFGYPTAESGESIYVWQPDADEDSVVVYDKTS